MSFLRFHVKAHLFAMVVMIILVMVLLLRNQVTMAVYSGVLSLAFLHQVTFAARCIRHKKNHNECLKLVSLHRLTYLAVVSFGVFGILIGVLSKNGMQVLSAMITGVGALCLVLTLKLEWEWQLYADKNEN